MMMGACPRISWTNLGWMFLWNRSEAQVCRRSWKVIPGSPVLFPSVRSLGETLTTRTLTRLRYTDWARRKKVAMAERAETSENQIRELSKEEGREMFDRAAQRKLGISGEEFLRRWDAGDYDDPDDRT